LILSIIPKAREDPGCLAWWAFYVLLTVVLDLIAVFTSKLDVIPPCAPVKRPGKDRAARTAREVAFFLLMGFVLYFAVRGSLPFVGQMSGWDMIACGFFAMAGIIRGFQSLFQRVEICGNGLLDPIASRPNLKPWEIYESFSWAEETRDGAELRLQAKSADQKPIRLIVRPEDREVVRQILEANLPEKLSDAHDGLNRRILPRCVPVRRSRLRRFAKHIISVLCWPTVALLVIYQWNRNVSLEAFSGYGFVSIMITMGVNFWPVKRIEICRNGLLWGDKLRAWDQYVCFFWKGETGDGAELRLPLKEMHSMMRLVVAPEDREIVQQLLEAKLQDRSAESEAYSGRSLF
jgi:hypothetical protein